MCQTFGAGRSPFARIICCLILGHNLQKVVARSLTIQSRNRRGMPTAIWTGSLSLGLVVVPVRLYPAVRKKAVRFHELDRGGRRVRHVRVAEPDDDRPEQIDRRPAVPPRLATAPAPERSLGREHEEPYRDFTTA